MVGRAAYHQPMEVLGAADARLWRQGEARDAFEVAEAMIPYISDHLAKGGRLHQITRHMLGLFHGKPGARRFRQILSEGATREGAGVELFESALSALRERVN